MGKWTTCEPEAVYTLTVDTIAVDTIPEGPSYGHHPYLRDLAVDTIPEGPSYGHHT